MSDVPIGYTEAESTQPPTESVNSRGSRHQRILACTLCQQRKVKCDRRFPCANCVKSRAQCVPAKLAPRQRRRRYTERALLERLRTYEDLLRQNNILFEPLHSSKDDGPDANADDDVNDEVTSPSALNEPSPSTSERTEGGGRRPKSMFHTMSLAFRDPDNESDSSDDGIRESSVKQAWEQQVEYDQHLLFGGRANSVDLFSLHPDPIQILRLWQVYVDNVNPILKISHVASLQARVLDAASKMAGIDPGLEALLFGIYCTALLSLNTEECQQMFGLSKEEMLPRFQAGSQEALFRAGFLRTTSRECLSALFLYLISVRPSVAPQTLSSMLGVAARIAQRMGLHREVDHAGKSPFEAEMRRRLWWSLVLFDSRVTQLAGGKAITLEPSWDCKIPSNISDHDLRPDMKALPIPRVEPTDAIHAVVRSEIGDFIRYTDFHIRFMNPAMLPMVKHVSEGTNSVSELLRKLQAKIEDQVFKLCVPENPLHFSLIWTTKTYLAKYDLFEANRKLSSSPTNRTDAMYDDATACAIRILEYDTKAMTAPFAKGFRWFNEMFFPFPAYYHLSQDIRRRPNNALVHQAWDVMSVNWEQWFNVLFNTDSAIFQLFSKILLQAWEACEANWTPQRQAQMMPSVVTSIRDALARLVEIGRILDMESANITTQVPASTAVEAASMPATTTFANQAMPYGMGFQPDNMWMRPGITPLTTTQSPPGSYMNQMEWTSFGGWPSW